LQADDVLRKNLTEAIAQCCKWGRNRELFGKNGAVAPLVKYLKSPNIEVHASTAKALHQLSKYPENCITMHHAGVVRVSIALNPIRMNKTNLIMLFFSTISFC
jgi:hypothetical protein